MFPLKDDNPTTITPVVTWALIAVNAAVFLYQVSLGPKASQVFVYQYGAIPAVVTGVQSLPAMLAAIPPFLSIFTSMFLHGSWMHLIGNMWYLWIFGNNIEEAMGGFRYLAFYLVCGLLASMSQILPNAASIVPTIGASGAIAGVLGAYTLLYPRARVLTFVMAIFFVRLMYIPAGFILGFWFVFQIVSGRITGDPNAGGIAFGAHIGGFIAGMLLVGLFKKQGVRFFNQPGDRLSGTIDGT
jgi:membrane associated rhomboid family serine protease